MNVIHRVLIRESGRCSMIFVYKGEKILLIKDLKLIEPIQKALKTEGYIDATSIQTKAIPSLLEGKDLLGCAQTGTGKTAAFAIPILQKIALDQKSSPGGKKIKALVLAPTRELAIQISDSFKAYGRNLKLKTLVIYGGVSAAPQKKELRNGVDILVATPGRLLDLIGQKYVNLKQVQYFVLDEADLMLDMGMLRDVKRIITYIPKVRQTMFFSATMPSEIEQLSKSILKDPLKVVVTPVSSTVDIIEQEVYYVDKANKIKLLVDILKDKDMDSALVFSRTKHGANKIVQSLEKAGLNSQAIHGNKSQNARQLALSNFKERKIRILVATDIAARGIDIEELSHVINFDLPEVAETYVHRIGRTGRAKRGGVAISLCSHDEKPLLLEIEKLISKRIPVVSEHGYPLIDTRPVVKSKPNTKSGGNRSRGNSSKKKTSQRKDNSNNSYKRRKKKSDK